MHYVQMKICSLCYIQYLDHLVVIDMFIYTILLYQGHGNMGSNLYLVHIFSCALAWQLR